MTTYSDPPALSVYTAKYDGWNHPVITEVGYFYDGLGRRVVANYMLYRQLPNHLNWFYDETSRLLEETNYGQIQFQNIWDIRYVGAPVAQLSGTTSLYYTEDANFNVTALIDGSTGNVVQRYTYTPYGVPSVYDGAWNLLSAPTYKNYFTFAGYQQEPLNYPIYLAQNRTFHSILGCWMERDPLRYDAGSMDFYEYVRGRPIIETDPSGLAPGDWWDPRTYSLAGLAEGFGKSFTAFGRGVAKGAVGMVTSVRDVTVGTYYGLKTLVTDPGSYCEDVGTAYTNLPAAVVDSFKGTIEEIQADPTKVSELAGSATFDLATFILVDKGASKIATVIKDVRVLRRLEKITDKAVEFIDADRSNLERYLIKGQKAQYQNHPRMRKMLRGKAIEEYARELAEQDEWLLEQIDLGSKTKGPDVLRKGSDKWYDWTTSGEAARGKDVKYPGKGHLLITDPR